MERIETRYVIAYDVPDTPRRNRIAAILEGHATRMQKSVFEAVIEPARMDRCVAELNRLLNLEKDSLAVYRICRSCDRSRRYYGRADDSIGDDEVFIV